MPQLADRYADHPIVQFVRSLDGDYYLRVEAAESLGIAQSMLPYLATRNPELQLGPSHRAMYGEVELLLYTPERIEEIRTYLKTNKRTQRAIGHRRMFTPIEVQERRRLGGRMREYRKRADRYEGEGRTEDAKALRKAADLLSKQLTRTHDARVAELTRKRQKKG
jgi:hypothetical protein